MSSELPVAMILRAGLLSLCLWTCTTIPFPQDAPPRARTRNTAVNVHDTPCTGVSDASWCERVQEA
jgi:hypothetical protein